MYVYDVEIATLEARLRLNPADERAKTRLAAVLELAAAAQVGPPPEVENPEDNLPEVETAHISTKGRKTR